VTDQHQPEENVTPFGIVKLILVLLIGLGALLIILTLFGVFAWLAMWHLFLKLGAAAGVIIAAVLVISWLMQGER
jgi:hypothetical protein